MPSPETNVEVASRNNNVQHYASIIILSSALSEQGRSAQGAFVGVGQYRETIEGPHRAIFTLTLKFCVMAVPHMKSVLGADRVMRGKLKKQNLPATMLPEA